MRIAVYHNQASGGGRRSLLGFCRQLGQRHTLDVFTLTSADQEMLRDEEVATSVIRLEFRLAVPVRFGLYLNDLRRSRSFQVLANVNREAAGLIDAGRYDAVLVDEDRYMGASYVLGHLRSPAVYFCHHRLHPFADTPQAPASSLYATLRDLWHGPFERRLRAHLWREDARLMARARARVVTSTYMQARMRDIYGLDTVLCRPGLDVPPLGPRQEGDYVLSVGALERHKGHDLVVDALSRLPAARRPALQVVANDANPGVRAALESQAAAGGVELRISMLPAQEVLQELYRQALLFAYGAHMEPLGLAPLEAMSHGVPVVAVGEAGVLETVEDGVSGLLTARDPGLFAMRMDQLLADAELRRRLGDAGRAAVERDWSWGRAGERMESILFEETAAGTSSP